MMPYCQHRRCKNVAVKSIGELEYPGDRDGFGNPWKLPIYLCQKHVRKIRRLLKIPEEEK